MSRQVLKSIEIKSDVRSVFNALIKPKAIKQWWSASQVILIPQANGIFAATWGDNLDNPDYTSVSRISKIEVPRLLSMVYEDYKSEHGGLPFEAEMQVSFELTKIEKSTKLQVTQLGFPDDPIADEYYEGCTQGWENTLSAIKTYVESQ